MQLSPYAFVRSLCDRLTPHQQPVNDETESESHEPRVRIQPVEKGGIADSSSRRRHRADESGNHRSNRQNESDDRSRVDSLHVGVASAQTKQIFHVWRL